MKGPHYEVRLRGKRILMAGQSPDLRRARAIGMHRAITRRDFVQGIAAGSLSVAMPALFAAARPDVTIAAQDVPGYYPPALTGLRGSHPGSFELLHALRDGTVRRPSVDTGERYDLIVVGTGLSGLAAAHFYRASRPRARILLLDNHDDFGGHAKRNEFAGGGRLRLMNGGTLSIESPRPYGPVADGLLRGLGIDVAELVKTVPRPEVHERLGLGHGVFFDRETFGYDRLVAGVGKRKAAEWLAETPLSERARADVERLYERPDDWMPRLTSDEKKDRLSRISYRAFLTDIAKADDGAVRFLAARTHGLWGVGIDAVSALDCWGVGLPGFESLQLSPGSHPRMGYTPAGYADTGGSPVLHFPDGNATIARLLVRSLIPAALPGHDVGDSITARLDYSQLDRAGSDMRLRLSAPVVQVRHAGEPASAREVEVTWERAGVTQSARAIGVVLACYGAMIPFVCRELPAPQREALRAIVKTPLVYASVAVRSWRALARLGIESVYAPGSYFSHFSLNETVDLGSYVSPRSPDEPTVIHLVRTPCRAGMPELEQHKAGRAELLATPFATFEFHIRDLLARALGPGGFDPAQEIEAITVNRWPHGYAPEYNPLWDAAPDLASSLAALEPLRKRHGRIAIANSDVGGGAYTDVAIEQGYRAVQELLRDADSPSGAGRPSSA
jgi:spermidine dehydrogenase